MRVAILKKTSRRRGDFLAVLLLTAILAGVGWLWWQHRHPAKAVKSKPLVTNSGVSSKAPNPTKLSETVPVRETIKTNPVVPNSINPTPVESPAIPRPPRDILEAQMALARRAISPGSIDGAMGSQTRAAIAAFQRSEHLTETATLDTNTRPVLVVTAPLLTEYVVSSNDLAQLQPLGKTWLAKSEQSALAYETELELVAEKAHSHPLLIQKLNPAVSWTNVSVGTVLKIPAVDYPEPAEQAAFVFIHLSGKYLEAFGTETNLLLHCPCSIAAKVEKRPVGSLKVVVVAPHPNYTFDPAVFPESPEAQAIGHKLILQPGPNNPVGVAWIGLDRPGYGMHGTPSPEQVGRTESHGCFRLANWDADYLLKLVWVGMPVEVVP